MTVCSVFLYLLHLSSCTCNVTVAPFFTVMELLMPHLSIKTVSVDFELLEEQDDDAAPGFDFEKTFQNYLRFWSRNVWECEEYR